MSGAWTYRFLEVWGPNILLNKVPGQNLLILTGLGQNMLIPRCLETKIMDFVNVQELDIVTCKYPGSEDYFRGWKILNLEFQDQTYWFLEVLRPEILIFRWPGIEHIVFWNVQEEKIRVRGLGYPELLISCLGVGACGVVSVGMFVVVSVSVVVSVPIVVFVVAPPGGSPRWGARPTRDPPWAPCAP